MQITIQGGASQKEIILEYSKEEENKTLLEFLLEHNFPIAYSCDSEGVCKKCIFNGDMLSCKFRLRDLRVRKIDKVSFSYL